MIDNRWGQSQMVMFKSDWLKWTTEDFWKEIADYEAGEISIESSDVILASARAGARMDAYEKLFWMALDG